MIIVVFGRDDFIFILILYLRIRKCGGREGYKIVRVRGIESML